MQEREQQRVAGIHGFAARSFSVPDLSRGLASLRLGANEGQESGHFTLETLALFNNSLLKRVGVDGLPAKLRADLARRQGREHAAHLGLEERFRGATAG